MIASAEVVAPPRRVFLSFHPEDRPMAEQVRKILNREAHAKVSSTDTIGAGDNWAEALRHALRTADVFVLVGTPRAQLSDSVLLEVGMAWGADKPFVIVTDRADRRVRLPVDVRALKEISLDQLEREGASEMLTRLVEASGA